MNDFSTVIIGGGISGLTCAKYLNEKGYSFLLLEGSDALGGRVRTDNVDGFLLDRGFQILLTNYPEAKKILNYSNLDLRYFNSGAMIKTEKGFMKMENPFKNKMAYLTMAFSSVGTLSDKLKIRKFANELAEISEDEIFNMNATDTLSFLRSYGWSDKMINNFFKPFFGGVFLENELATSSNFFQFVFKQFFKGDAAIPAEGMQAIPEQIAEMLPKISIRKNARVKGFEGNQLFLDGGEVITADRIVVATDPKTSDELLGENTERAYNTTTCTYFSAEVSPLKGQKFIALNPNRKSVVHNVCVPSDISSHYGQGGKTLISVSTQGLEKLDERNLTNRIKRELFEWFGAQVNVWKHLKTYHIPESLVQYRAGDEVQQLKLSGNLYRCGDYLAYPSLNAAMKTGREVAQMIME
ncbi:amine oxidase [Emticicia oligotrophica DSM 17448]|uniref:Amine oxidase n=1 Tax=Emticicia oligotrophica (strain DSM 17448 / CIP 109782 / MTCC 6937 / GPTSA100-15) TaxID=929562 RepID=A0ABM5MZN0_EMTOG|nr:NAD(P)/FAD-dependent oxidoreductase [Emticicia oligotrophica]AFK02664.1 amine oxidase [Emticicia oligotrophica DSM 17448]